jgi:tetratricopeptide (TPR) repeat protein
MVTIERNPHDIMTKHILVWALFGAVFNPSIFAEEAALTSVEIAAEAAELLKAGETKDAIKRYEAAIAAGPDSAELQSSYAHALTQRIGEVNFMAQGMIAGKMLKAYQRSVELDPDHIRGWIGLCRYYLNAPAIAGGSAGKAESYAREVHARVPYLGEVELGLVEEKRGNHEVAAAHYQTALELKPDYTPAINGLKRVNAANGSE